MDTREPQRANIRMDANARGRKPERLHVGVEPVDHALLVDVRSLEVDVAQELEHPRADPATAEHQSAPAIPYANTNAMTFVSARTGCVVLKPNLDLTAVCLK